MQQLQQAVATSRGQEVPAAQALTPRSALKQAKLVAQQLRAAGSERRADGPLLVDEESQASAAFEKAALSEMR